MSATPFAMYYGRGALLGHFLMEAPKPVKKQPLNYPKNEEVAEKQLRLTLSVPPPHRHYPLSAAARYAK